MSVQGAAPGRIAEPPSAPAGSASYEEAMREGDGQLAERIALTLLASGLTVADLYEDVVAPAMANIGALWAEGAMSIADEHLASALNLKVMSSVFGASLSISSVQRRGRILLVGVEGDRHGVGLRMAGDVLELAEFEVLFLGEDVAPAELIAAAIELRPDLITLAVPTISSRTVAESTVRTLARECPELPLLVGGRGLPPGEETFADHASTVSTLRELPDRVAAILEGAEPSVVVPYWPNGPELDPKRRRLIDSSPEDRLLDVAAEAAEATRAHARIADAFRRLAHEDPLTGVRNRRAFEDRLEQLSGSADAYLAMVDLDGFKAVNDRLGHAVGDEVLRRVAAVISALVDEDSLVARLGGDEFAVIFTGCSAEHARARTEAIIERLRLRLEEEGVTATAGLAALTGDRRDSLLQADLALYRGKEAGGDRVARQQA